MLNSIMMFTSFTVEKKYSFFLEKFGKKYWYLLFKLRWGAYTNLKMQSLMVMYTFFRFGLEILFFVEI